MIIVCPFHLFQVFNHRRGNRVIYPFILSQSFEDIISDYSSILCLEVLNLAFIQISIVVTFANIPATLYYLIPVEGAFLVGKGMDDTFEFVFFPIEIIENLARFILEGVDLGVKGLKGGKCQICEH